jgi:guanylate kinase
VNDDLDRAAERLRSIFTAERCRRRRAQAVIEPILKSFQDSEGTAKE